MKARSLRLLATAVTAIALFAASPAPQLSPSGMVMNGYQIETDQTNWNLNSGDFTMPHEVKVTRPGTDARGDHAKGNTKLGPATLIGGVIVHDNGNAPEAKEAGSDYQGPATITCDELTI